MYCIRSLKKHLLLLTLISAPIFSLSAELALEKTPYKTFVLQLPSEEVKQWKEINRTLSKDSGIVERIPLNQTIDNWTQLIAIQYFDLSQIPVVTMDKMIEMLKKTTAVSFPNQKAEWKIIDKKRNDLVYEWFLFKPKSKQIDQHEIARININSSELHRIGFTQKERTLTTEERDNWIKKLKDNSSLVKFENAANITGIALNDPYRDSVVLGPKFQNWVAVSSEKYENGHVETLWVPKSSGSTENPIEGLEVITKSYYNENPNIDHFLRIEEEVVSNRARSEVHFSILKRLPNELYYIYHYPYQNRVIIGVGRTFLANNCFYWIDYRQNVAESLNEETIRSRCDALAEITLKT